MTDKQLPQPIKLLTTKELAAYVNKPVPTIRTWRARKVGPPGFRLGREVVYRLDAVNDWIASLEAADARTREHA